MSELLFAELSDLRDWMGVLVEGCGLQNYRIDVEGYRNVGFRSKLPL